jgi:hypothetical protein
MNFFEKRFKDLASGSCKLEKVPLKHCTQNMWVVKPSSLNQGRGIEVYRNV